MIKQAMQLAEKAHEGQTRTFQGVPYVWHPHSVMKLVKIYSTGGDMETLQSAAVLHDVVEDTSKLLSDVKIATNSEVRDLVAELTSDEDQIEEDGKAAYLADLMVGMSDDALFIKLCDRLDNVTDLHLTPDDFRKRYTKETLQILRELKKSRSLETRHIEVISRIQENL